MKFVARSLAAIALCLVLTSVCHAQTTPAPDQAKPAEPAAPAAAAPAAPAALPTPAITGPLAGAPPFLFDGGPFGKIAVNGIVSGFAMGQDNSVPGDKSTNATLSNGQVWIQKTDGWFQFYMQAGAYTMPALATPYMNTGNTVSNFYGPLPVAFVKLVPSKTTSILIGELPTLIGAEYTFTFENMNIERGLLWNQENAVSRGVQINQAIGKYVTASLSLNDGFYSNRYTWLTGSLTVTKGPHALAFVGGGNFDQDGVSDAGHSGAKQQQYLQRHLHVHQGAVDHSALLPVHRRSDQREDRHHQRGVDARRGDLAESRLQTRLLAGGARGIHLQHGNRRSEFRQLDVRSGQRGHVGHRHTHLSIWRLLRSRRYFPGSCEQHDARLTLSVPPA